MPIEVSFLGRETFEQIRRRCHAPIESASSPDPAAQKRAGIFPAPFQNLLDAGAYASRTATISIERGSTITIWSPTMKYS